MAGRDLYRFNLYQMMTGSNKVRGRFSFGTLILEGSFLVLLWISGGGSCDV